MGRPPWPWLCPSAPRRVPALPGASSPRKAGRRRREDSDSNPNPDPDPDPDPDVAMTVEQNVLQQSAAQKVRRSVEPPAAIGWCLRCAPAVSEPRGGSMAPVRAGELAAARTQRPGSLPGPHFLPIVFCLPAPRVGAWEPVQTLTFLHSLQGWIQLFFSPSWHN